MGTFLGSSMGPSKGTSCLFIRFHLRAHKLVFSQDLRIELVAFIQMESSLSPGDYLMLSSEIHSCWRLIAFFNLAFQPEWLVYPCTTHFYCDLRLLYRNNKEGIRKNVLIQWTLLCFVL